MHRQNFNAVGFFRRARGLPKYVYVFGNKVAEKCAGFGSFWLVL